LLVFIRTEDKKKKKKRTTKRRRRRSACAIRDTTDTTRKFTVLKNPTMCPFVLLVKVMLEND
jgi:hypothetical protein